MKSKDIFLGLGMFAISFGPIKACNGPDQQPSTPAPTVSYEKLEPDAPDGTSIYMMTVKKNNQVCYFRVNPAVPTPTPTPLPLSDLQCPPSASK